jgi:hypothetical protein
MLQNEALSVVVPTELYVELLFQLRKYGDTRQPEEVLPLAIKAWLASYLGNPCGRGYQWKELFLPDGTELRTRYRGVYYYAKVEGDQLRYGGISVSPRSWVAHLTGSVRNAWRDVWIRQGVNSWWVQASAMRIGAAHDANRGTARAAPNVGSRTVAGRKTG